MDNPLLALSLTDLRQRQSLKWRLYGDDVLPLWVAEMDVLPPEPRRARLVANVMTGVSEVLRLVTGPGDAVVFNSPVYPPFYGFVHNLGRRVVEAPLSAAGRLDPETLAAAFVEGTRSGGRAAYLLSSPHNPTGAVHTVDE